MQNTIVYQFTTVVAVHYIKSILELDWQAILLVPCKFSTKYGLNLNIDSVRKYFITLGHNTYMN